MDWGHRFWLGSWGRLVRFSLVNTDWKWFDRIFALDLLSVCSAKRIFCLCLVLGQLCL